MAVRSIKRYVQHRKSSYENISEFLSTDRVHPGLLTINYEGVPLDLLYIDNNASTMIVVFHAALSHSVDNLPVFSGLRMLRGVNVNVVCVSDPSLNLAPQLKLAWFGGSKGRPLQSDLPVILRKIITASQADRTIFFGASGGGFAALYYAAFFDDSLAIVINPQTVIRAYTDRFVLQYAQIAFGARNLSEARSHVDRTITGDLRHLYRGGFRNTVAYVQNIRDRDHVYRHAKSFLDAARPSDKMFLKVGDWGKGHVPPPTSWLREIVESVVNSETGWNDGLLSKGFVRKPTSEHLLAERRKLSD